MTPAAAPPNAPAAPAPWYRQRRIWLWSALVLLLVVAQSLLVGLTVNYEATRAQEATEAVAVEVAAEARRDLVALQQQLQSLAARPREAWPEAATELLHAHRALVRLEWRDPQHAVLQALDSPLGPPAFTLIAREEGDIETEVACAAARRSVVPVYSRSYFVPLPGGLGQELMDLCVPLAEAGEVRGYVVAAFALGRLLEASVTPAQARGHELSFVEGDGTRLARTGLPRGAGVFRAERLVDLPGATLQLRVDSATGAPRLIPNLSTALVLGLSIALFALVMLLAHDVRRRARVEAALAEALAVRKAMEDSLVTGLRARDLDGRITYVNPAFCAMVGFTPEELRVDGDPPYWPPEHRDEYRVRQAQRLAPGSAEFNAAARQGHETVFMRKGGERFPVMIYEAPLVDGQGRQTGWMSAVLDVSAQRSVEELSRQQQERLQATARLATVGEMASLMSHELNQPLAAIASYASGSLNLLDQPDRETPALLRQALGRIAEQAERAGRVIKSVHDFVRRREQAHEPIGVDQLFDAVLPLVRLQARKSGTRVELDLPALAPRVVCDRTMVEQVLLNLTRNGIQAMEAGTPPAERVLHLAARRTHDRWVTFSVTDAGPGLPPEVAARLFTPFFTTRREGMGLGLSLCRTVIEQHGGALDFGPAPGGAGTEFRFTLPTPRSAAPSAAPAEATAP
jgi:two-component system sensor histidine kinase DctS